MSILPRPPIREVLAALAARGARLGMAAMLSAAILAGVADPRDCLGDPPSERTTPVSAAPPAEFESVSRVLIPLVLEPHTSAISGDGALLATGHADGSLLIWDAPNGLPRRRLSAHVAGVDALAFHPTEPLLASGGEDRQVRLWNAATGELLRTFEGHTRRITALAFSPDGRWLLSGAYDKTSRRWDLGTAPSQGPLVQEHRAAVGCVAFSNSGDRFATGDRTGEIHVWNESGEAIGSAFTAHKGAVNALAFAADDQLISGGDDGAVVLWNPSAGERRAEFTEIAGRPLWPVPVTRLAIDLNRALLLVGNQSGNVALGDLAAGKVIASLQGHTDEISGLGFLPASRELVTTSFDCSIRLWSPKLPATPRLAVMEEPAGRLWSVAVAPDDRSVFAGGQSGFLAAWDMAGGQRTRVYEGFDGTIDCIDVSPDGSRIGCCGWKVNVAALFDVQSGILLRKLSSDSPIRCIRFLPDGLSVAIGQEDGVIKIWPAESGSPRVLSTGALPVYDIAFSPDGKLMVGCTGDWKQSIPGSLVFWNAETWTELTRLTEHTRAVRSVAFNADGSLLASTGDDGMTVLWRADSHTPIARMQNSAGARAVRFSPDGGRLAIGLDDGVVNVWEIASCKLIRRFRTENDIFGLAYSQDGTVLFSTSGKQHVEAWADGIVETLAHRIRNWDPVPEPAVLENP